jgi:hypothetical protein
VHCVSRIEYTLGRFGVQDGQRLHIGASDSVPFVTQFFINEQALQNERVASV